MQTETDIMRNLAKHLVEEPNADEDTWRPQRGDFRKQQSHPTQYASRPEPPFEQNRRRKFTFQPPPKTFQTNPAPETRDVFDLAQGPLKESHFFDMIDMMQRQSRQARPRGDVRDEDTWWDAISKNKPY